jgi:RNA polymerase sigma-70 factor (ECF subfamily)
MTVSPLTQEFIAGFHRGSYESVRELYHLYYSSLLEFAEQLTLNKPEAHHIVQETFIKLYLMRTEFNNVANIKAFLYITVRNICFNYIKSNEPEAAPAPTDWYAREHQLANKYNDEEVRNEAISRLFAEAEQLPEQYREVFGLIFCKRLSVPAAAAALQASPVTVAQDRIKAIRLLRERLFEKDLFSVPLFIYFLGIACSSQ